MWITLDNGTDGSGHESVLPGLEALAQYVGALQRTLLASGIDGISGALQIARHVEEALGTVSAAEVARVRAELRACETRLRAMARAVDDIGRVKRRLLEVQAAENARK